MLVLEKRGQHLIFWLDFQQEHSRRNNNKNRAITTMATAGTKIIKITTTPN